MKTAIAETQVWVEKFVVGLGLCPFAAQPLRDGKVRFTAAQSDALDSIIKEVLGEILYLDEHPSSELSTTIFIIPKGLEAFLAFLDFVATIEDLLEQAEVEDFVQLAHFHPHYQFANTAFDEPGNRTNRSPYPILQLLRVKEVAKAIKNYPAIDEIPTRNIELMQKLYG